MKMMVVAATALAGSFAFGETLTWTGDAGMSWTATAQNWKTADNTASAWVSGSDALFTATGAGTLAVDGNLTASTLTFDGTGANYTFNMGAGDATDMLSSQTVTVTNGAYFTLNRTMSPADLIFNVAPRSKLCIYNRWLGIDSAIYNINGGTFMANHQGVYTRNFNLSNGALVTDLTGGDGNSPPFRFGCAGGNPKVCTFSSKGTDNATNVVQANITLWEPDNHPTGANLHRIVFDVEQPLLLSGRLFTPAETQYSPQLIEKIGSGTMIMMCNSIADGKKVGGAAVETLTAAVHVVEGTLRCDAANCFRGYNQPVVVKDGAILDLALGEQQMMTLTVEQGGLLKLTGANVIGSSTAVVLDGGKMHSYHQLQHIRRLTLRNGGEVEAGEDFRFGYGWQYPVLASEGVGTNVIATRMRCTNGGLNTDTEQQAITFKVDAPLRFTVAPIHAPDSAGAYSPRHYWKTGASELILDYNAAGLAKNSIATGTLDVIEGTLRLAKTYAMYDGHEQSLVFSNGTTFAVSAGTTNSVMAAEFHGEVTLEIGENAALSFDAYDLNDLTQLDVTPIQGATSLRFGTSQCLTAAELGRFNARGYTFEQDAEGYIHAVKNGMILIFR